MDWLDLLAVQRTLKSVLQHHSSKAAILWCTAFFIAQLSHSYMTTGKTTALTRWTFVNEVMSLLFIFFYFYFILFNFYLFFYQLEPNYFTILQWFLSYIDMNQPLIYMYSPSQSPLPPPSLPDLSGSSQCTRSEHLSHASNLSW